MSWSLANRALGYRQGMNELAGVLFMVHNEQLIAANRLQPDCSKEYSELMNKDYREHDVYSLFDLALSTGIESFYAHEDMFKKKKTNNISAINNRVFGFLNDDYNVSVNDLVQDDKAADREKSLEHLQRETGGAGPRPALPPGEREDGTPVVHDVHKLSPRKWLRVLFFREFSEGEAIRLWDSIFAYFFEKGTVDIIDYIAIAMLESAKDYILMQIDVSGVLQKLLKFNGSDAAFMVRRAVELEGSGY